MRIFPLGDSALTIEFGTEISLELNAKALNLASHLSRSPFDGFIEAVPAYSSLTVYYDPIVVKRSAKAESSAFEVIEQQANIAAENVSSELSANSPIIEIPVDCDEPSSPDIGRVADHCGLSRDEVLDAFLAQPYRVYMLGFLPGFAYMGNVDERIAAPRLDSPRIKVLSGSIGIAGRQTGIYPLESPGGWNIIGRTTLQIFDPTSDQPCLLRPGDQVRFVRV